MDDYLPKLPHWPHQLPVFLASREREEYALFMEQRTGKSKVLLDTAAWLYSKGRITGLLVVSINGVDFDWSSTYLDQHWPDWAGPPVVGHWEGKLLKKTEAQLYNPRLPGLRVLAMNVEAFSTSKRAIECAAKFLRTFNVLMAIDESSLIKDPSASRTKNLIKLGRLAKFRRILTGTPWADGSPLDIYSQFQFLDEELLGFRSFYAFKARYAELMPDNSGLMQHIRSRNPRMRGKPQLVARNRDGSPRYQNLDELRSLVAPHAAYVTRAEADKNMPPKIPTVLRSVPLTDEQQDAYNRAKEDVLIELQDGELTIDNQLTRLLRLQQITGGWMPRDNADPLPLPNNRVEALLSEIELLRGGVIIWARFKPELRAIAKALRDAYGHRSVVEYHGGIEDDLRETAKRAMKIETRDPAVRFFVGNQATGAYGLELTGADNVFYYSNLFSLEKRLQSEDRPIHLSHPRAIGYTDLVAPNTVDMKIVRALAGKRDVADTLRGDGGIGKWLEG